MPTDGEDGWMPAWLALVRTHNRLWDRVEAQMRRDHGLTMARYDVLAQLDMAGGRLGLSELAASLLLSPSGLSKLLDRMETSGLVRRDPDPRDARAAFAAITPRGRSLARSARKGHHAFLERTFADALDADDLADLTRIMNRIRAPLQGHPATAAVRPVSKGDDAPPVTGLPERSPDARPSAGLP
jgi:DNA-binding MarR family transcriptional regulator